MVLPKETTILSMIRLELLIDSQNFSYKFPQQRAGYQLVPPYMVMHMFPSGTSKDP
jgi:hypothetical protein